jgi:MtN3 and saliva related transmembrane protein
MFNFGIDHKSYSVMKKEHTHIDKLMLATGIIGPLSSIPQIWLIYSTKNAEGISLLSWLLFTFISLIGLAYSISHNLKILVVGYGLWLVMYVFIIVGILLY